MELTSQILSALCLWSSLLVFTQSKHDHASPEFKGSVIAGNVYVNPALSMTIDLPGTWQIVGQATRIVPDEPTKRNQRTPDCHGPLCGEPSVDVFLESRASDRVLYGILLNAYKLSQEYQNRKRHPLLQFAKVMTRGSLGGRLEPEGDLIPVQLSGKPAFKLTVHPRNSPNSKIFLYVGDADEYVFLLVATAVSGPEKLRAAIESMKISPITP